VSYSKGVNIPHKALNLISNHRDPTLINNSIDNQLRLPLCELIRQEGANKIIKNEY
jgi:hypothetical protein